MRDIFLRVLREMEECFRKLEDQTSPPVRVPYKDGFRLRYNEQSLQQALLQKFARQISGLHTIDLLLLHGFVQEQGVIQRTLDEIAEDIIYLSLGNLRDDWTSDHQKYLDHFWSENAGKPPVQRHKIRAYVNSSPGVSDPSAANANGRTLYQSYSGYVHAASANIIDMCVGTPPRYNLNGMLTSPLYRDHLEDAWNYFYRGLMSSVWISRVYGDEELQAERYRSLNGFEQAFANKILP